MTLNSKFVTSVIRPSPRVPKKGLRAQLDVLAARGVHVFAGLYTLALGMEMTE